VEEGEGCRLYGSVDYVLWWRKPVCLQPATLTTGRSTDAVPGALGQPNTQVVLGSHRFEFDGTSGVRPFVGGFLTSGGCLALEGEGLIMERAASGQSFRSTSSTPATFLPFQSPTNAQQALPFTIPGAINGSASAIGSSRLWGAESNLAVHFSLSNRSCLLHGALLVGFRYLDLTLRDALANQQTLAGDPTVSALGASTFTTRNQFYGGQVGWRLTLDRGNWSVEYLNKLAAGDTHVVSQVAGGPLLGGTALAPGLVPGPLLAQPSNVGRRASELATLVPEVGLKLRYRLTENVSLSLGYTLLYWNRILCPGDQMDPHLNVTQLPGRGPVTGPALPEPLFVHTDTFAQGLSAGIELRF
jgi:hypothetical protein